jgi:hypothetical protein
MYVTEKVVCMMALVLHSSAPGAVWCSLLMEPCKAACRKVALNELRSAWLLGECAFQHRCAKSCSGRLLLRPATPQCFVALQWLCAWLCFEDLTVRSV